LEHKKYYIGVDIGTTSTKAVIFDKNGNIITTNYKGYSLHSPEPGIAEQDPDEILDATIEAISGSMAKSNLKPEDIKLISFSAAMHSVICVDSDGNALSKCITWADSRSHSHALKIKNEMNGLDIYQRTGTPIHAMSPLSKLMWLKDKNPDLFSKTHKFIGIKEYIFYKFFGEYIVDHSIASTTGLFNLKNLQWDQEVLQLLGIDENRLSKPVSTTFILENLRKEYALKMGLNSNILFVIGASDGVLSNLGVNAINPSVVAVTIGTSGAIRTVSDKPITDPKGRIFCYALTENHFVMGGPVNNGGIILRWIKDELASAEVETAKRLNIDPYDILTNMAENVNAGSDGLIFHPYLAGERAPLWDANARGSFFGLGLHHRKEHMVRAALEGVILNLYTVMTALEEIIGVPTKIQATGGFVRSTLWRQMMADIFNQEVVVPESFESSCLGAVVLGMYALGEIKDFSIMSELVGNTHIHKPIPKNVEMYQDIIPIYANLSKILKDEHERIANFQRKWILKD